MRIDWQQNRVEVHSSQSREKIAAAIREEGYAVAGDDARTTAWPVNI